MPPEADQGNGSQGQESGAGNQGQGQEPGSQQGQQNANQNQGGQGQGQESGQGGQGGQGGTGNGQADISAMKPEELASYAAKLQKDAAEARQEAANYRTQYQAAQGKITEAERAQMSELEKVQTDLTTAQSTLQEKDSKITELESRVEDLTKGAAVRNALTQAGALNPATAFKVGSWDSVKVAEDGTVDAESFKAALGKLRETDGYLFRRTASADAGAGGGNGSPEAGSSINDFVRGQRGR